MKQKKEIQLDFSYDDNLTDYMTKYLPAINDYDEVKYDFLANNFFLIFLISINKIEEGKNSQLDILKYLLTTTPYKNYKIKIGPIL